MVIENFGQQVSTLAKQRNSAPEQATGNAGIGKEVSAAARSDKTLSTAEASRQASNRMILEASLDVSLKSGDQSMTLLYRSAVDNLNEILEPDFGPDALQRSVDEGLDVSPEATAERIVSLTTAFFSQYREQNPDMDEASAAQKFTDIIRGGIEQGFNEAREILDGMQVLEGDIASNIDKTFELTQQKLDSFLEQYTQPDESEAQ